ncbi:hypothetical protein [Thermomonas sp.]|uniref:hypothetical protein n=1 Tax=Thermomonas sp. TaxID=1971895 RepID=UPI002612C7ED|nr:hypothetical protein [Thermomonas sp.]MCO5056134.1 hypothetical protein [Thermomonas sp.]
MNSAAIRAARWSGASRFDTIAETVESSVTSAGGLLLIASAPLPDDALFQFRFCLNDDGRPLPTVEVGAHVLWQAPAGAPGQHYVGMRFIGLAPETALLASTVVRSTHQAAWMTARLDDDRPTPDGQQTFRMEPVAVFNRSRYHSRHSNPPPRHDAWPRSWTTSPGPRPPR